MPDIAGGVPRRELIAGPDRHRDGDHRRGTPVVGVQEAIERDAMRSRHATAARRNRQVEHLQLLGNHNRMVGAVVVGNRADRNAVALCASCQEADGDRGEKCCRRATSPRRVTKHHAVVRSYLAHVSDPDHL